MSPARHRRSSSATPSRRWPGHRPGGRGQMAMFEADLRRHVVDRHETEQALHRAITEEELRHPLPAVGRDPDRVHGRSRGAGPLGSARARVAVPAVVHPDRRGVGADPADGQLDHRQGLQPTSAVGPSRNGRSPMVTINLAARQLAVDTLVPTVVSALQRNGLHPTQGRVRDHRIDGDPGSGCRRCEPEPAGRAGVSDRHRRLRHRPRHPGLHPPVLDGQRVEDRPVVRGRARPAPGRTPPSSTPRSPWPNRSVSRSSPRGWRTSSPARRRCRTSVVATPRGSPWAGRSPSTRSWSCGWRRGSTSRQTPDHRRTRASPARPRPGAPPWC